METTTTTSHRSLQNSSCPSVTVMSTMIVDDNLEFKALQQQLKTGGATTSAGIKHILHDHILIRFNEMKEKGLVDSDEEEVLSGPEQPHHHSSSPEDATWSEILKKRMALSNFRRGQQNPQQQQQQQQQIEKSLFEKAFESNSSSGRSRRTITPTFASDTNIYAILLPEHSPPTPSQRKLRRRTVGTMTA